MTSNADKSARSNSEDVSSFWWTLIGGIAMLTMVAMLRNGQLFRLGSFGPDPEWDYTPTPLVMNGGDPYIRALMRTISASESNSPRPYSLLYGGSHFYNFSYHPDTCVTIVAGPNEGDCTTAAGRYQMLTSTWIAKAQEYHPQSPFFFFWQDYSFAPEFQDEVVYNWLNDPSAWGVDLSQLLRDGRIEEVLEILSPTWTSLGYGIESNSMTDWLPQIYDEMLTEELATAGY